MRISTQDLKDALRSREVDLGVDVGSLDDVAPLAQQGVDSLGVMDIVLAIKDVFGVKIPSGDLARITSLATIADYVNQRRTDG